MSSADVGAPDKMTVFQKCVGSFNRTGLLAETARSLLTELVHLFYLGETFQEAEATQLFFTITKLFQKESAGLKQMVYLAIKELVPLTDNVIMGTSVLMRDVQQAHFSNESKMYRPQALRALCRILDAGAVEGMDRLMRSTIVDKDENMSSAALVSAYHLLEIARDSVKRWATEIQEACIRSSSVAQYHALGLLYEVRQHDPMALLKLVVSLAEQNSLYEPNAMALHIRLVGQLLVDQPQNQQLLQILKQYCYSRSEIVALEAAKTTLAVVQRDNDELVSAAIGVLHAYLESPRATSRFAAIRALNKYAVNFPEVISSCNEEMEQLVSDSNQAIATYAITTLLKTGSEANMDSLIERVGLIAGDRTTSDDFRLVVVDAVRSLAKRFPAKHDSMLNFFADLIQHPGNLELKLTTVEAISDVLHTDSDKKALNNAIAMLCETIEDSEYPEVIVRVLHLLGAVGPNADDPSQCVRIIYNRVILENSTARAAAVVALSKFTDVVPGARSLVERCRSDPNDEVRDRASIAFVTPVSNLPSSKMAMADLEAKLLAYLTSPDTDFSKKFDISNVQLLSDEERFKTRLANDSKAVVDDEPLVVAGTKSKSTGGGAISESSKLNYASLLREVPELSHLGEVLHTGPDQKLTDDDMEYVVNGRVHLFEQYFVLQYDIQNNYELELSDVTIEFALDADLEGDGIEHELTVPLPTLKPNSSASTYLVFKHQQMATWGFVTSTLDFTVDGDHDQYQVDELEIRSAEFVKPLHLASTEFESQWSELNGVEDAKATHQFKSCSTIVDALERLQNRLGMLNCGAFPSVSDTSVGLLLAGVSALNGDKVLAKAQLIKSARSGVAGKVVVRSNDTDLAALIADGA